MNEKVKKTALITGASSGIGNELSRLFAQDGYNLILISNNKSQVSTLSEELEEKYNIFAKTIVKDLSKQSSPDEIFKEVTDEEIEVNVIVNNTGSIAESEKGNAQNLEEKIQLLGKLTHLVADKMMNNGGGKILNIALTDSKREAFLLSNLWMNFSKYLTDSSIKEKIKITTFYPGSDKEFFVLGENYKKSSLSINEMKKVESAAKACYKGLKEGKNLIISGIANKLLFLGLKLLPQKLINKTTK